MSNFRSWTLVAFVGAFALAAMFAPSGVRAQGSTPAAGSPDGIVIAAGNPDCRKSGNCTLKDIVDTGVAFATFLMGLSAALFFAVFIYGGAMYLLSFGDAGRVKKGKDAIKGAAIGLILVLGAWTIVQTLVKGIGGPPPGGAAGGGGAAASLCAKVAEGYKCTTLKGTTTQEAQADATDRGLDCKTGFCPNDPNNVLCCRAK